MKKFSIRGIDWIYRVCGYLSAFSIVCLLVVIVAQVVFRWLGSSLPGASGYAGYLLGISTFLGLAYTLLEEGHIRVELFLGRFGAFSRILELWSVAFSVLIVAYMTWYFWGATYWSFKFNDLSSSLDDTPLWIPQLAMTVGSAIFTLALLDRLIRRIGSLFRTPSDDSHAPKDLNHSEMH